MNVNEPLAEIEEVTSVLTAADGVPIDQALADAGLSGYQDITINREANTATVTWFKKERANA